MEFVTATTAEGAMTDVVEFNDALVALLVAMVNEQLNDILADDYLDAADGLNPRPTIKYVANAWVAYLYKKPLGVAAEKDIDISVTYKDNFSCPLELRDLLNKYVTDPFDAKGYVIGKSFV